MCLPDETITSKFNGKSRSTFSLNASRRRCRILKMPFTLGMAHTPHLLQEPFENNLRRGWTHFAIPFDPILWPNTWHIIIVIGGGVTNKLHRGNKYKLHCYSCCGIFCSSYRSICKKYESFLNNISLIIIPTLCASFAIPGGVNAFYLQVTRVQTKE